MLLWPNSSCTNFIGICCMRRTVAQEWPLVLERENRSNGQVSEHGL